MRHLLFIIIMLLGIKFSAHSQVVFAITEFKENTSNYELRFSFANYGEKIRIIKVSREDFFIRFFEIGICKNNSIVKISPLDSIIENDLGTFGLNDVCTIVLGEDEAFIQSVTINKSQIKPVQITKGDTIYLYLNYNKFEYRLDNSLSDIKLLHDNLTDSILVK